MECKNGKNTGGLVSKMPQGERQQMFRKLGKMTAIEEKWGRD